MPSYTAPVEEVLFLLRDVFNINRDDNLPGFADATPDTLEAVLNEGGKFCEEVLAPLNQVGDREGCKRNPDGSVTTPTGFKDAYKSSWPMAAGSALRATKEFGGQGLPFSLIVPP